MKKQYALGFWNYPAVTTTPLSEVARWKNAGMTCIQTPSFDYEKHDKQLLINFLDEIERCEMTAFLCIRNLYYNNFVGNVSAFREKFLQAYRDFGKHPAVRGFFIGDEPANMNEIQTCEEMFRIIRQEAPETDIFLNFLPYWIDIENRCLGGQNYEKWLDSFLKNSGCKILSTDCYDQMNPEKAGIKNYYDNLYTAVNAAKKRGAECFNTVLSCGHYRYRVPNEDDLRWQLNTSVACGCTGIYWFLYYNKNVLNNYRGAPVDELGEESLTYTYLRRVQRIFLERYADRLINLNHQSTYHFNESFGQYPSFYSGCIPHVRRAESEHRLPGLISEFTDAEGNSYIVIVNNSQTESDLFNFRFDPGIKVLHRYWGERDIDLIVNHNDARYSVQENCPTLGLFLAPGQLELLRPEY